jgi:hypothetical protein
MTIKVIYEEKDWESVAVCIRSEQISADEVVAIFNDNPKFKDWYVKEYIENAE